MKSKYVIGLLIGMILVVIMLTAGYQISYRHVMDRQASGQEEKSSTESIAAEGNAVNENDGEKEGYWICQLQGYVAVYLSDRSTIYELTDIMLTELPEEVQQEIIRGKYIGSAEELYAFLENYSS